MDATNFLFGEGKARFLKNPTGKESVASAILCDARYAGLFVPKQARRTPGAINRLPPKTARRRLPRDCEAWCPLKIIEDAELEKKSAKFLSSAPCERRRLVKSESRRPFWNIDIDTLLVSRKRSHSHSNSLCSVQTAKRRKVGTQQDGSEAENQSSKPEHPNPNVGGLIELVILSLVFGNWGFGCEPSPTPAPIQKFLAQGALHTEEFLKIVDDVSEFIKKDLHKRLAQPNEPASGYFQSKSQASAGPLFTILHLANVLAFFLIGALRVRFDCNVLFLYEPLELELVRRAAIAATFRANLSENKDNLEFATARNLLSAECSRLDAEHQTQDHRTRTTSSAQFDCYRFSVEFFNLIDQMQSAGTLEGVFEKCAGRNWQGTEEEAVATNLRTATQREKLSAVRRDIDGIAECLDVECAQRAGLANFAPAFRAHECARLEVSEPRSVEIVRKTNHFERTVSRFLAGTKGNLSGKDAQPPCRKFGPEDLFNLAKESPVIVQMNYADKRDLLARILVRIFDQETAGMTDALDNDRYSLCVRTALFLVRSSFGRLLFPGEEDLLREACEVPSFTSHLDRSCGNMTMADGRDSLGYRGAVVKALKSVRLGPSDPDNRGIGYNPEIYETCLMCGTDPVYFVSRKDANSSIGSLLHH